MKAARPAKAATITEPWTADAAPVNSVAVAEAVADAARVPFEETTGDPEADTGMTVAVDATLVTEAAVGETVMVE